MTRTEVALRLEDGRSAACRPPDAAERERLLEIARELQPLLVAEGPRGGTGDGGASTNAPPRDDGVGAGAGEAARVGRPRAGGDGAAGGDDETTLLAALAGDPERIVGITSVTRRPGAREGRVSVGVHRDWRALGLGTALLEQAIDVAGDAGLEALWSRVPAEAGDVMARLHDLGASLHERPDGAGALVRVSAAHDESLLSAEADRFAAAAAASLEPMMRPRAIAVVGASRRPAAPGGAAFRAILAAGFPGPVYAVNRSGDEVAGHPVHRSLRELPGPVDLVVVAVPAAAVPAVAHDAVAIGAGAMVVISSGFAETGPEGRALEADLLHIARTGGLRVLGPNCLGLAVTDPERPFDATFGPERPPPGRMAFASQSGGLGIGALAFCRARGIGLSAFASLGNKADLSSNDLLGYWSHDERTRVILLYLEGFGNPRRFARLARSVARRTPIVALKGGRSPAGLRAAGSHTAALAAGEGPTDALFRLAGVVRVDTVEDLFETGQVLADQPLPRGPRVAIVSNAGGPAILAADTAADLGLEIPAFDDALVARIRAALPSVAAPGNPVDLGAGAAASAYAATIGAIAEASAADAIIAIHTPTRGDWHAVLRAVQAQSTGRIPIVGCLLGRTAPDAEGASRPVPWLGFPESAAKALARAVDAGRFARRVPDPPHPIEVDRAAARAALAAAAPGAWLDPARVEQILRAYGIPTARSEVVSSAAAAAAAQSRIGRPVAVKLRSSVITHKSDVGGVVLGCETPASARAAYREIAERVGGLGEGAMEGALVQEQAPGGLDVIVGAVADPVFGPLVVAGMGGVQAELWGDRALALAPIGPDTAARMWSDLRGAPLIAGYRGGPAADREALVDILQRVALLAHEQPLLGEMDLNPVRALAPGAGALTLDARIRRAEA